MDQNDKNIADLVVEIQKLKKAKPLLNFEEIKDIMKGRGEDDELDLAIILSDAELSRGKFADWTPWVYGGGSIVLGLILLVLGIIQGIIIPIVVITWYFSSIQAQRKSYLYKALAKDLSGQVLEIFNDRSRVSSAPSYATYYDILECTYDSKRTIYGHYQWTTGSGKNKQTHYRTFVMQFMKKNYDKVMILPQLPGVLSYLQGEDVELESVDFNKKFIVKTDKKPQVAFDLLQPRLMDYLLNDFEVSGLSSLEVNGDFIFISYKDIQPSIRWSLSGPIVRFTEFISYKKPIIKKMDIVSDITDIIHRDNVSR